MLTASERRGDHSNGFKDFYQNLAVTVLYAPSLIDVSMRNIQGGSHVDHLECERQLLSRNVQRFRGGRVFKAHRLLYHSTLGVRVIKKKKKKKKSDN